MPYLSANRWLVAFSGGVDSQVLLDLLVRTSYPRPSITAIHINHQLHPSASDWAQHCRQLCDGLGVDLQVIDVDLQGVHNLEARARQARYQAFEGVISPGDVMFMGHHGDDQIETFFQRLLRGSGTKGLASMPSVRQIGSGQLCRPLLSTLRSEIECYAKEKGLAWVEDPSNQDDKFDRNFLRLNLSPLLEQRWPAYRNTILRSLGHIREDSELLDDLAAIDLTGLAVDEAGSSIAVDLLLKLSLARRKNVIRYWLVSLGYALPTDAQMLVIENDLIGASDDSDPLFHWSGSELRRYSGRLYVMPTLKSLESSEQLTLSVGSPLLIQGCGELRVIAESGSAAQAMTWQVRFRKGGERCRPSGRGHSQSLKKLFQEYRLPPWLRDRTPLIYHNDELVAVAGIWVCHGYEPAQYGYRFIWQAL